MKSTCFFLFLFFSIQITTSQTPEEKLDELGIELLEVQSPSANFVKWRQVGNLLFLAGDGSELKGKLGRDLSVEEGYQAARQTGVDIISTLKAATGDLSRIKQFVKVRGMVNSTPEFYDQPKVINGFSDLMVEVFGEKGKHARAAVGHCSLPSNIAVEIEVVVELEN
ncbi:RidA family protein [Gramella sp. GC03-9]|uniref:RidA family protein n=1 Tax=Christiangramia oceanisediminis TaxID=2920386 RepID=A0A9X2I1Z0_9FLAO|nr:RidA family protein [Gramella oceanisediminis]MCP9198400.1 RidA family protein [Gramella oceanisediminis]